MKTCNQKDLSNAFSELAAAIPLDLGRCVSYQFFASFVATGEFAPAHDAPAVERMLEFMASDDSIIQAADRFLEMNAAHG